VEKTTQRGALRSVLFIKLYSGDQIKKNEMGGTCSTYEREERRIQCFGAETSSKETTWKTRHRREKNIKMGSQDLG
jgi:hypothetical protein